MKKIIFITCALTLHMTLGFAQKKLAVMTFEDPKAKITDRKGQVWQGDSVEGTGILASDLLQPYLLKLSEKLGSFELIEREQLAKVMQEQALGASGVVDSKSAAQIGNVSGADYLITGKVVSINKSGGLPRKVKTPIAIAGCIFGGGLGVIALALPVKGYKTIISVKMIDSKTGALKTTLTQKGNSDTIQDSIDRTMKRTSRKMVRSLKKVFPKAA